MLHCILTKPLKILINTTFIIISIHSSACTCMQIHHPPTQIHTYLRTNMPTYVHICNDLVEGICPGKSPRWEMFRGICQIGKCPRPLNRSFLLTVDLFCQFAVGLSVDRYRTSVQVFVLFSCPSLFQCPMSPLSML